MTDAAATPEASDSESIFHLARTALAGGDHDGAAELFERAARDGAPELLWRITEVYAEAFDARAAVWMSRAVASMSTPDAIVVHPGTLRIMAEHGVPEQQLWSVEVRSSADDRPRVVTALEAAVPRLMRITHDGRALTAGEMDAALAAGVSFYSPNYAAVDAAAEAAAPRVWLDCKDAVMPAMARSVIRVLLAELGTAGVRRAELCTRPKTPDAP
ncbi:hypothetical protein ACWC5I_43005 [Kitasatospora sp. NPDC001574]